MFIIVILFIVNLLTANVYATNIENSTNKDDYWNMKSWDWDWTSWTGSKNSLYNTLLPTIIIPIMQISLRIYVLMIFTMLFTSTTRPTEITGAIESLLRPLKVVRFPVEEVALIISIALRFIPTILDETGLIMNAQASRGVDFSNGNLKSKAISISTLVIPMFANSFQRADDLANAIEARGYVIGEKRTKYKPFKINLYDVVMSLIMCGMLIVIILLMVENPNDPTGNTIIPKFIDNELKIDDISSWVGMKGNNRMFFPEPK